MLKFTMMFRAAVRLRNVKHLGFVHLIIDGLLRMLKQLMLFFQLYLEFMYFNDEITIITICQNIVSNMFHPKNLKEIFFENC